MRKTFFYMVFFVHVCKIIAGENTESPHAKTQKTVSALEDCARKIKECVCQKDNSQEPETLSPRQLKTTEFQALLGMHELLKKLVDHNCKTNPIHAYTRDIIKPEVYMVKGEEQAKEQEFVIYNFPLLLKRWAKIKCVIL